MKKRVLHGLDEIVVDAEPDPELKIGSALWHFNENRRVYPKTPGGFARPIWREHWETVHVIGETSRSWIIGGCRDARPYKQSPKLDKAEARGGIVPGYAFSEGQIDRLAWVHNNGHRIAQGIPHCTYGQLRAIAEIIGYQEPKQS